MTAGGKQDLLEQLAAYGYRLTEPSRHSAPEDVMDRLLRQREGRLLEGLPVVLLTALREKAQLLWERARWDPKKAFGAEGARRYARMLAVSYLLFRLFAAERRLQERVLRLLDKCQDGKQTLSDLEEKFSRSETVRLNGVMLSTERLKRTFRTYYVGPHEGRADDERVRALELDLLLSELFTPRQKELLRKRAARADMTNTEKAYFYRTVRKRLKALANEEVHALARRLLAEK